MHIFKVLFLFVLPVLILVTTGFAQVSKTNKAIICLTYDDGLESQILNAIPQLDSNGIKATFFINSILGSSTILGQGSSSLLAWKNAASKGHELGNHTLFHPCPQELGWQKQISLQAYDLKKLMEEIELANRYLQSVDGIKKQRSFAAPCNNEIINGSNYIEEIVRLNLAKYIRIGGDSNSVVKNLKILNFSKIPSMHVPEGASLKLLINFAEKIRESGGLAVYQFHGIGGSLFKVEKEVHKKFLQYLNENKDEYWITTFSEAMEYIDKQINIKK